MKKQIKVEFLYTPPYSPDLNLAEYFIHLLKLEVLHDQPVDITMQIVREKVDNFVALSQVKTLQQIKNTLEHIYR